MLQSKANLLPLTRANTPDNTHPERQFTKIVNKFTKNVDAMGRGMLLFVHGGNSNGNEIWRIYESVPNEKWNVA